MQDQDRINFAAQTQCYNYTGYVLLMIIDRSELCLTVTLYARKTVTTHVGGWNVQNC